jgi:hypothetical protein
MVSPSPYGRLDFSTTLKLAQVYLHCHHWNLVIDIFRKTCFTRSMELSFAHHRISRSVQRFELTSTLQKIGSFTQEAATIIITQGEFVLV